jgi:hypothetical protein
MGDNCEADTMGVTGAIEPADDDMMAELLAIKPLKALCCGDEPVLLGPVEKPRWPLKEHCWPPARLDVMMTGLMAVETRPILLLLLLADDDDIDGLADSSSVNCAYQR